MPQNLADLVDIVDGFSQLSEAGGELIQMMPGFNSAARGFCRVIANTPGGQLSQNLDFPTVCTPFWDEDGISPPTETPQPFTGGQCSGTEYEVNLDVITGGGVEQDYSNDMFGPISFGGFEEGTTGGGAPVWVAVVNGGVIPAGNPGAGQTETWRPQIFPGSPNTVPAPTLVSFSVSPINGPDNCGDPPPIFNPGEGAPDVGPGDVQIITGPDGVDREIVVEPFEFNDDEPIQIPVTIDGVEVNLGTGEAPGPTPSESGAPIPGAGDGEQDVPPHPDGLRCIAVTFRFAGFSPVVGRVLGGDANPRYYKVFGNADVLVGGDDAPVGWIGNVDLQSEWVTIGVPASGTNITKFRANLLPGLTYTATPIYGEG